MRTFQARLAAKLNKISQKLADNSISLMGTATDVIRLKSKKNNFGDIISRSLEDIDVVEIRFPALKEVPMWRFDSNGVPQQSVDIHSGEYQPFKSIVPLQFKLDQDDILIKFFENPQGDKPLVLVLQVKDVLGTFGDRSIIYQQYNISYYDEQIETEIWEWVLKAAQRRGLLGW